jgi:hypothetical protein
MRTPSSAAHVQHSIAHEQTHRFSSCLPFLHNQATFTMSSWMRLLASKLSSSVSSKRLALLLNPSAHKLVRAVERKVGDAEHLKTTITPVPQQTPQGAVVVQSSSSGHQRGSGRTHAFHAMLVAGGTASMIAMVALSVEHQSRMLQEEVESTSGSTAVDEQKPVEQRKNVVWWYDP